ncbi:MAG: glycyl-radical enzyme activating protein [Desulfobacteria bacterium]
MNASAESLLSGHGTSGPDMGRKLSDPNDKLPLIFDIHPFALDDGPGIRTTVFFKGCPLSCLWCHNPESMKSGREIAFYPKLCIKCGDCKTVCREDAISLEHADRIIRDRCTACGRCAEECPTKALRIVGKYYPVSRLIEILMADRIFYETSKGGITFSGGEPTLYMDYVGKVMKELKANNLHVAIETCGMFDLAEFKARLLPYIDLILFDIKLLDSDKHQCYTGKHNKQILRNFVDLVKESDVRIVPRVPLVPGITATSDNLTQIAAFLKNRGCSPCRFLSYNPGGIAKRIAIGKNMEEKTRERR